MKIGQRQRHLWVYHQPQPADNFAIWRPYTTLFQNDLCKILQICTVLNITGPTYYDSNAKITKQGFHIWTTTEIGRQMWTTMCCSNPGFCRQNHWIWNSVQVFCGNCPGSVWPASILDWYILPPLFSIQVMFNIRYTIYITFKNSVKPRNDYDKFRFECDENGRICARKRRVVKTFVVKVLPKWVRVYSIEMVKSSYLSN